MACHPITAFKNPVTRPRAIIWTGTILALLCMLVFVMFAATTSYWFCAGICHSVQDDTISSYQRSSHSNVSCVACHLPANANPLVYTIHKVESLPELPMAILGTYTLPLNAESEVSQSKKMFPDTQCTQCHDLSTREVTPSDTIIIDHTVHTDEGVRCTMCHNRVAHNESGGWTPKGVNPKTKKVSTKHADFLTMTACYRCHGLEKGSPAPGTCSTCHPKKFNLKPSDHSTADFMKNHGKLAEAEVEKVAETTKETGVSSPTADEKSASVEKLAAQKNDKSSKDDAMIAPVGTINRCYTCHDKATFCDKCHGMSVPHSEEFKNPTSATAATGHPVAAKNPKLAAKCVMCHGQDSKTAFCSDCHHGTKAGWTYDAKDDWTSSQHSKAVAKLGIASCTKQCHTSQFCLDCHKKLKTAPASHKAKNFVYPSSPAKTVYGKEAAKATAGHATLALKSTEECAICHGTGGANAQFCKNCHGVSMPHAANFKKFHSKSKAAACSKCHSFKEVCSDCHHVGATDSKKWITAHGASVNKNGFGTCVGTCHQKNDCVTCHQKNTVKPDSHKAKDFVKGGGHAQAYKKSAENCTFCHAGTTSTLANSKSCKSCHKLVMPHATDSSAQKFEHKQGFASKKYTKAMCYNCHSQTSCDSCHHKDGYQSGKQWMYFHPTVVKKSGSAGCFKCHKDTYCAQCHTHLTQRGLKR